MNEHFDTRYFRSCRLFIAGVNGLFSNRKLQEQVSHLDRAGSRWPVIL